VANSNNAAAANNAYAQGYNAAATTANANVAAANANAAAANANAAAANANAAAVAGYYTVGQMTAVLPAGCITPNVNGQAYYLCGNTWFSAAYGANGVYYRVVTAP
jgi:predicted ATPase